MFSSAFARVGFSPEGGSAAKKRKSSDEGGLRSEGLRSDDLRSEGLRSEVGGLRSEVAVAPPKKRLSSDGLKSVKDTMARKSDLRAKIPGRGLSDKLKSRLGSKSIRFTDIYT